MKANGCKIEFIERPAYHDPTAARPRQVIPPFETCIWCRRPLRITADGGSLVCDFIEGPAYHDPTASRLRQVIPPFETCIWCRRPLRITADGGSLVCDPGCGAIMPAIRTEVA